MLGDGLYGYTHRVREERRLLVLAHGAEEDGLVALEVERLVRDSLHPAHWAQLPFLNRAVGVGRNHGLNQWVSAQLRCVTQSNHIRKRHK